MLVVAKSTTLAFINEIIYILLKRTDCEYKQAILGLRRAIKAEVEYVVSNDVGGFSGGPPFGAEEVAEAEGALDASGEVRHLLLGG